MTQIHLNVPTDFWKRLYARTDQWPGSRADAHICRYAMDELYADHVNPDDAPHIPEDGPAGGKKHLQVHARNIETAKRWDYLRDIYGSYSGALRIALQHLLNSLEYEEDDEE